MSVNVKVSVYMPESMHREIRDQAIRLRCSTSVIIRNAWENSKELIAKRDPWPPIDGPSVVVPPKKENP